MKKTSRKALTAFICAALLLSGCTWAENPAAPSEVTTEPADTSYTEEASDTAESTEEKTEAATSKRETEIIITSEETETEAETAYETVPPAEKAGEVPDSYREDGENGIKIIGRNGHYMGLMGCWGTTELCGEYAEAVNRAAEALPNVSVYSMVIPTSSEFYTPEDITGFTASQKNKIDYIAESLSGAVNIDVYSALVSRLEEPLYTRTDHHWQPLGAYYAAEVFAKAAGAADSFAPLSEYTAVTKDGYVGSLYSYSESESLYSDPETFTMYISPNDGALKTVYYDTAFQNGYESDLFVSRDAGAYYCSFLGSDDRIAEIETDCGNGRTLVIFKESYGNALVPFLTQCFQKIYVCDVRYFDLNAAEFCESVGATDLLFAVCTYTPAGPNCSYVRELF
ncbi:MAG: DHHW family protein [Bacteroides sp.]|nr:DHHW family protein [Bacteroides sp.]